MLPFWNQALLKISVPCPNLPGWNILIFRVAKRWARNEFQLFWGGALHPCFDRYASASRVYPNLLRTWPISDNWEKNRKLCNNFGNRATCCKQIRCLLPIYRGLSTPNIFDFFSILVRVPTKPINPYKLWWNTGIILACDTTTWNRRALALACVMRRRLEINIEVVASTLRGLVKNCPLQDIFTMVVTNLAFCRSPVANKHNTDPCKVLPFVIADNTWELNKIYFVCSKRHNLAKSHCT